MKRTLLAVELASMLALTIGVVAVANDAVSEANGKIDVFGGRVDGNDSGNLSGSYTVPVQENFGAQLDGLYGRLDNEALHALGGHLFWRDPGYALLGLYGSYGEWDKTALWRAGAEGEIYLPQITFAGQLGNQSGDLGDEVYGNVNLRYYLADDNVMLAIGGGYIDTQRIFSTDIEYLTGLDGISLFATGAVGSDNYDYVLGGIRYYFGSGKSLMLRHRNDDPFNYLFSSFSSTISPSYNPAIFGRGFGDRDATPE